MGSDMLQRIKEWNTRIQSNEVVVVSEKERTADFLFLLCDYALFFMGLKIMQHFWNPLDQRLTARLIEWCSLILIPIFGKLTTFRIRRNGLTVTKNEFIRTMKKAGFISVILVLAIPLARMGVGLYDDAIKITPHFSFKAFLQEGWFYPAAVILQEFLAKGLLLEKLKEMMGPGHIHAAIWACGIVFFVFHFGYPLYYMFGAAFLCIITGYLYETDHNIWGCSLVHYSITFFFYFVTLP